jgi:hypothetical protein
MLMLLLMLMLVLMLVLMLTHNIPASNIFVQS